MKVYRGFAAFALCTMLTTEASADVSSWLSLGGGYGLKHNDSTRDYTSASSFSGAIGVGSDSLRSFVVGGIVRSTTYFGLGTDVGLAARVATGGFARGQWGLALDVGPMWRSFGHGEYGRWPLSAMLVGGGPWGLQVSVGGEILRIAGDDADARGMVALLEIDLLRLTVMRQGATDKWWQNPSPAGGRPATETSSAAPRARAANAWPLAGLLW